jgi:dephospho-CoA kinase
MIVIGLTGGVAAGKNFVAGIFAENNAVIFDADKEVHKLLESDKSTIFEVKKNFPESFVNKKINRKILGDEVFFDFKKLKILETILHQKVQKKYLEFLLSAKKTKQKIVVLNVPLLLENKGYKCDYVIAIISTKKIRKERFLKRALQKNSYLNKSELSKKFQQIVINQISDIERKKCADFVIKNNSSCEDLTRQVVDIMNFLNHQSI